MLYGDYRNFVKLTHLPTEITVKCNQYRSQHKNRESCIKRLLSLIHARQKGITPSKDVVFSYTIHDNNLCPDDLFEIRREVK